MYASVVATSVAVQCRRVIGVCPHPVHLFIEVLAKVGYIEDTTAVSEARICQVFSQTFEHRERNLPCIHVHNELPCEQRSYNFRVLRLCTLNCAILTSFEFYSGSLYANRPAVEEACRLVVVTLIDPNLMLQTSDPAPRRRHDQVKAAPAQRHFQVQRRQ
jgi:hypothetical protein